MADQFDFISPDDKPALLAITTPEWLATAEAALIEAGYKVHSITSHSEFPGRFSQVAWPSFLVLVATGIWNVFAVHDKTHAWKTVLMVKIMVVILSGLTAYLHQRATSRRGLAVWGALTGLTALGALVIGIALAG